jgi:Amt family ammonium transporter
MKRLAKIGGIAAAMGLSAQALAEDAAAVTAKIDTGDTAWILASSALVMLMTPGLAFFYGGMVRTKNVVSTLYQNFAALGVIGLLWAIAGYSIAFGPTMGGFLGGFDFSFLNGVGQDANANYSATIPHIAFAMFQCMFAIITPVLMTGTFAERVNFKGFLAFIAAWSLCVYAPIAHWVWGVGGWIRNLGGLDFAGGMVVHMSAGWSALALAILFGKRKDFGSEMKPYDTGMILLGTALLWFGWFGFNAGSALGANGLAAHAFATTFLASAAAFVAWSLYDWFANGKPNAMGAGIGAVAGLVVITPGAGFVSITSAIFMGLCAGIVCNFAARAIKNKFKLDDSLDVFACHGVGGTLGTILTAVFASKAVNSAGADGLAFGDAAVFKANLIGGLSVAVYSIVATFVLYKVVNAVVGLRSDQRTEDQGLDSTQHGEVINSNFESGRSNVVPHKKVA